MSYMYGGTVAMVIGLALGVLRAPRPVIAGYSLTGAMAGLAAVFWELGYPLLGGVMLLLYTGGVLVTVLFVIMLTTDVHERPRLGAQTPWLWLLVPAGGLLGTASYPGPRAPEPVAVVGQALLRQDGMAFEGLALLLLVALVAAIAIHERPPRRVEPPGFKKES